MRHREDVLSCQGKRWEGANFGLIVILMTPVTVRYYNNLRSPSSKESKSCWTRLYCLINFISSTAKLNTQSKTLNNFLTPRFLLQFQTTVLLSCISGPISGIFKSINPAFYALTDPRTSLKISPNIKYNTPHLKECFKY